AEQFQMTFNDHNDFEMQTFDYLCEEIYDLYQEIPVESNELESTAATTCEEETIVDDLQPRQHFENIPKVEYICGKPDPLIPKVFNNEQLMQENSLLIHLLQQLLQINKLEYSSTKN
ncbi:9125_t:CDS:1, partial [Funneliformis geosporum]